MKRTANRLNVEHRTSNVECRMSAAALALLTLLGVARAGISADYSITPQTLDGGGGRSASADYTLDASAGLIVGRSTVGAPAGVTRHGYIGQLADPAGFVLAAEPASMDEDATRQLAARVLLDDDSQLALAAAEVAWSVAGGPLAGIDAAGLAMAGSVYQDTPALARGLWGAQSNTLTLTVLNTLPDNFGSYAADGLDDDWQIGYYGFDNPAAAPGHNPFGTGDNLFKFFAGLNPTDAESRLHLRIARAGAATALEVEPIVSGRTYSIVQAATPGAAQWDTLVPHEIRDSGAIRTFVSDTNAPSLFYRVRIQKP